MISEKDYLGFIEVVYQLMFDSKLMSNKSSSLSIDSLDEKSNVNQNDYLPQFISIIFTGV